MADILKNPKARRDFHILNEPYERAAYFEITRRLSQELGLGT